MSTADQMQKAKTLIQQKRYDDARALLITIDHPQADKWLTRLNQMGSVTIQATSDKSFTVKLFVTIVLLFFIIPGVIALAIFAPEARKYPDAPGAKGLILLNRFTFYFIIIAPLLLVALTAIVVLTR